MPTEENNEEIVDRIALVRSSYISQLLLYQEMWKKFTERWGVSFPMIFPTPIDRYKVDEKVEDKVVPEITLEDLNKELEDGVRGIQADEIHIDEGTDSIWFSEMMQNLPPPPVPSPHPAQDSLEEAIDRSHPTLEEAHPPMRMSELTGVGDLPEEVGRQIHESMERISIEEGIARRIGETDEEYRGRRNRIRESRAPITGTPNRLRFRFGNVGAIFLAHQNRDFCEDCDRVGCSRGRCETTMETGECPGFLDKRRHEVPDMDCVICGSRMDSPENFPMGFPDKWKACCFCVETWSIMGGVPCQLIGLEMCEIETRWDRYCNKMLEVFTL